ncbi:Dabb family protein [Sphingobacterium sp. SRCM116780]|uniref:Dabb family protein n=1 Tax=Sphingobacterium sp. SRCM116780 TaxID=2907623 RepID=UPI001F1BD312|nr:Dabb family protein [Sphingobacterium sp. SRCM116780]UIR54699.1 Dabb family protein [Sphingobacterium sp. SRCM116780]
MERKKFLKSLAIVSTTGTVLQSCTNTDQKNKTEDSLQVGFIFHSVYFWLKDGITEEEEHDFLNFFEILKKISGIVSFHTGKPAATNPRPVVDNSFSYHIMLVFTDLEAITSYEKHPDHLAAIEKYSKYWKKVEVKDTLIR